MSDSITIAGVRLSSPDRVLWPGQGVAKRDLAGWYEVMAHRVLPHVAGRPLTLLRCPRGRGERCFVQRHTGPGFGKAVRRVAIRQRDGRIADHPMVEDVAGLVSLVQIGVLELHAWGAPADDLDHPDRVIFDLDPGEGVAWPMLVGAAHELRGRLADHGLDALAKTSGGKGIHVVVPIARRHSWDTVKAFSRSVSDAMAADAPDRYTVGFARNERAGRILIDYLRNDRAATAVAPWTPRARPGAPVSMPLAWDALDADATPDRFTLAGLAASAREGALADSWPHFPDLAQTLPPVPSR